MKLSYKIGSFALGAAILFPTLGLAQEVRATSSASSTKIRDIKNKIEEKREDLKTRVETKKAELDKGVKERFSKFTLNIIERFDAALDRFNKIVIRIDSRIAKIKTEGGNTEEAEKFLAEAKLKISAAEKSVLEIKIKSDAAIAGDLRVLYPAFKDQVVLAQNAVKEAQKALIDVVNSLKPGLNKEREANQENAS